jgi:ParB family chromosome partitioning protein
VPEDPYSDLRKQLSQYEENLIREQLSLLELCEYLGKSKAIYEELYPETKHGGVTKKLGKDPGTRSLPYVLNGARMLGKSRATIGKLLQIYSELIAPKRLGTHPK